MYLPPGHDLRLVKIALPIPFLLQSRPLGLGALFENHVKHKSKSYMQYVLEQALKS